MAGSADQPLVVAVAALLFHRGRLLAMRRSAWRDAAPGVWETLSGRVRPGEEPLTAVEREVHEECGLEVALDPRPVTAYAAVRAGAPMVVIVYRGLAHSTEVVMSAEHDEHAWLTPEELAQRCPLPPLVQAARKASRLDWPGGDDFEASR